MKMKISIKGRKWLQSQIQIMKTQLERTQTAHTLNWKHSSVCACLHLICSALLYMHIRLAFLKINKLVDNFVFLIVMIKKECEII